VTEEVTAASEVLVVVIAEVAVVQADTPVQVATVAMVVILHMPELRVQVGPAVAVVLHCFVCQQVPAEVLVFKVKEEMVAPDQQVQILEAVGAEEGAPVAVMVWVEAAALADQ
jgi:hypothetical protein